mmetsp:Transcript_53702/g.127675  ORF Transcript_53702/g.127675 Transcript_53702/m.127675 type:complete len:238 (+) Transcript_53702:849-1562(+)
MTMVPAIASWRSFSVCRTTVRERWRTSISWRKQTLIGFVVPIFESDALTSSLEKSLGSFPSRSMHMSVTTSSRDLPAPPPPPLGCVSMIVSNTSPAWVVRNWRSALRFSPNTSGESTSGRRFSIAARYTFTSLPIGIAYPACNSEPTSSDDCWKNFSANVIIMRRSQSSVMRPPYWISAIMYRMVLHVTSFAFLASMSNKWFCRKRVDALRSDWLNSYGTVHPIAPYLRRSWTTQWA